MGSGEAFSLKGRKTQALVARLALPPGEQRTRDELVALLWSDRGEQQARSSLRQSLSELRKALGDADPSPLIAGREAVSLDANAVEVDVTAFERLIADGSPAALEQAVDIYQGDLLDGIGVHDPAFEDWLRDERQRLHERACEALSRLLDHQAAAQDTEGAITTARRLLALDLLQEPVHRALMRLYAQKGDRAMALRQYQACRDVLGAELGIEPEAETERFVEEIRAGAPGAGEEAEPTASGEPSSVDALPLPDKPSLAVLPFVNMSGDPEQEYFSDGITEDIITELSHVPTLFVTARNSSFAYKGQSVNVQQIGRELGVHYVTEGSVRKAGNRVRITAQLVDAVTGNHLWAQRYDRNLEDIFAVQDEVAQTIVATLIGRLEDVGAKRAKRKSTNNLKAYDYLMQGRKHLYVFSREDNLKAREMFERAVTLDPDYAAAHAGLAETYWVDWWTGWDKDPDLCFERFAELAKRSVALDDTDNRTHIEMGELHLCRHQYEEAKFHFEKAVALNPSDSDARMHLGYFAIHVGNHEEAIGRVNEAIRLNPFGRYGYVLGMALYLASRYDDAIAALKTVRAQFPHVHAWLAASYAQAGNDREAQGAVTAFTKVARSEMTMASAQIPSNWSEFFAQRFPFKRQEDLKHLLDGLHKAGLT